MISVRFVHWKQITMSRTSVDRFCRGLSLLTLICILWTVPKPSVMQRNIFKRSEGDSEDSSQSIFWSGERGEESVVRRAWWWERIEESLVRIESLVRRAWWEGPGEERLGMRAWWGEPCNGSVVRRVWWGESCEQSQVRRVRWGESGKESQVRSVGWGESLYRNISYCRSRWLSIGVSSEEHFPGLYWQLTWLAVTCAVHGSIE